MAGTRVVSWYAKYSLSRVLAFPPLRLTQHTGDELYNHLLRTGPMEAAKVQKIFTQLVGAVSYVHNKQCVHRDLKLENILLDKHGNVKLVDFGFTREYEGKSNYLQTWCGTVCYSAPEMLKGEKYAGEKVDVWSLGIILYALLAGELPFDEDDEGATKMRILKEEPKYTERFPPQAKELVAQLLSKRPLLRPGLSDILRHPWLADHAPQQQEILKLQQPAPFSTDLEKEVLQRMRSAGVDIDMVIENVLAQRCDGLAGWWALLLEKEERKAKRRERKRKEREAESKSLRRLSAASSRLERMAPTIRETDEEGQQRAALTGDPPRRGRSANRRSANCKSLSTALLQHHFCRDGISRFLDTTAAAPDLPRLIEKHSAAEELPPPPIDKHSIRSNSSSRNRPPPPPKDNRRSRSSMLQVVQTNPDLLGPNGFNSRRRRFAHQPFLSQFAALRNWFKEMPKRAKSPGSKGSGGSPKVPPKSAPSDSRQPQTPTSNGHRISSTPSRPDVAHRNSYPPRPRMSTSNSVGSLNKRPSLSPAPLTPHSSYRRSSGLRGRKSTSSSISSIRSIHHHHSHSKASSTSSASLASPAISTPGHSSKPSGSRNSPHPSVKVLPAVPASDRNIPSNIRIVRAPATTLSEASSAFGGLPPPSPGLVFAKRKRNLFKGPMLSVNTHLGAGRSSSGPIPSFGIPGSGGRRRDGDSVSRGTSVQGRRSGELAIQEEDEEEDEEDGMEVEEVERFSPVEEDETIVEVTSPDDGKGKGKDILVEDNDTTPDEAGESQIETQISNVSEKTVTPATLAPSAIKE